MDYIRKIIKAFRGLDRKKQIYITVVLSIIFVMLWAFISAGIITGNFNRAQLKGTENKLPAYMLEHIKCAFSF